MTDNKTLKCPYCGNVYGAESSYLYGAPLRTCRKCNKPYVDYRYHEIALEGVRKEDLEMTQEKKKSNKKAAMASFVFGILLLVFAVIMFALNKLALPAIIIGAILLFAGFSFLMDNTKRGIKKNRARLEAELQSSVQRMQDPQYVQALQMAGYQIPSDFTPKTTL